MTNFDFLSAEKNFATFADACIEAEKSIGISPALCALGVRKSAELAVKWLYSVDSSLRLPYKDNFSALVYNPSFTAFVDQSIINNLRFIIKLGNFSAHTNKKVAYREAVLSLQNLFEFVLFIDYCYGSSYEERDFDETLLASEAKQTVSAAELTRLREELETRSAERAALASAMKSLQEELAALRAQNAAAHSYVPHTRTEEETRRTIIDIDLRAMGWTFDVDCMREVPVIGLPNGSGKGFADYVLYGRDHKPLAVVEAKKTSVSPEAGREQARLYADCLEQMTGQRPLIFYTNGYDTYFWDDLSYPPRQVYSVFSQDDLVRIIRRRTQARGFDTLQISRHHRPCLSKGGDSQRLLGIRRTKAQGSPRHGDGHGQDAHGDLARGCAALARLDDECPLSRRPHGAGASGKAGVHGASAESLDVQSP